MFAYTGGLKGDAGAAGAQGDQGIQGVQGDQGIQGVQGDAGVSALTAYTNLDSDSNVLLIDHAYKAAVAGRIDFSVNNPASGQNMSVYVGATNDPVGAGQLVSTVDNVTDAADDESISGIVAKDEYFECTRSAGAGGEVILFKGFDTLGFPIDQD